MSKFFKNLFYVYLFLLPLVFYFPNGRAPFEFAKFILTALAAGSLFLGFVSEVFRQKTARFQFHSFGWPLLALVIVTTASYFGSIDSFLSMWGSSSTPADSLSSLLFISLLSFCALQFLTDEHDVKRAIQVLILGALPLALHGVAQYAGYDFDFFSEVSMGKGKSYSTLGLPGVFATYLGVASFLSIGLCYLAQNNLKRLLWLTAFGLFQMGIYMSAARLPFYLNLVIVLIVGGYMLVRSRLQKRLVVAPFVLAFLVALLGLLVMQGELVDKSKSNLLAKGAESRWIVWQNGLAGFSEAPLLGSGPETFYIIQKKYEDASANKFEYWTTTWAKGHNQLVQFAVTTGLLGLLSFLVLFGWVVLVSLRAIFKSTIEEPPVLAVSVLAGYVYIFLTNLTAFHLLPTQVYFYVFPVFLAVLLVRRSIRTVHLALSVFLSRALLAALSVLILALVSQAILYWWSDVQLNASNRMMNTGEKMAVTLDKADSAIELFPTHAFAHCHRVNVLVTYLSKFKSAMTPEQIRGAVELIDQSSQACIDLAPARFETYATRGKNFSYLYMSGMVADYSVSEDSYKRFQERAPASPISYYEIGLLKLKNGESESFAHNMRKAIELKPDFLPAYYELIKYYSVGHEAELQLVMSQLLQVRFYAGEFVPQIKVIADYLQQKNISQWTMQLQGMQTVNQNLFK